MAIIARRRILKKTLITGWLFAPRWCGKNWLFNGANSADEVDHGDDIIEAETQKALSVLAKAREKFGDRWARESQAAYRRLSMVRLKVADLHRREATTLDWARK